LCACHATNFVPSYCTTNCKLHPPNLQIFSDSCKGQVAYSKRKNSDSYDTNGKTPKIGFQQSFYRSPVTKEQCPQRRRKVINQRGFGAFGAPSKPSVAKAAAPDTKAPVERKATEARAVEQKRQEAEAKRAVIAEEKRRKAEEAKASAAAAAEARHVEAEQKRQKAEAERAPVAEEKRRKAEENRRKADTAKAAAAPEAQRKEAEQKKAAAVRARQAQESVKQAKPRSTFSLTALF
jgi:hypothetical protein